MRNDRNKEEAAEKDCFTHYELIENLSLFDEGFIMSKIDVRTMSGKEYSFECKDKSKEDFLIWLSELDSPMDLVTEYCDYHPNGYTHSIYTRESNWLYLIKMYYKDGTVI